MRNNVVRIIILCLLLIILMVLTVVVYKSIFEKSEVDTLIINENNDVEEANEEETNEDIATDSTSKEEDDSSNDIVSVEENNTTSYTDDSTYEDNTIVDNSDPVTYFEDKEKEVINGGTLEDFKGKFKTYFVEIVDFIFYDKEINGYTFDSLSNSAKLKVISIALKIDSMIDSKVPGYKETIWSSGNKIYSNAKEKLVTLYLDTASKVCENRGEECDKAKETFSEIKDKCKIGWSFIKSLASSSKDKLKSWYEVYRGK